MKKTIIILICIIPLILISIFVVKNHNKENDLNINLDEVISINIDGKSTSVLISNEDDLKIIYDIIKKGVKTKRNITKDVNGYKISINYEEKIAYICLVYQDGNNYYFTDSNNNIYKISMTDYQKIESYL